MPFLFWVVLYMLIGVTISLFSDVKIIIDGDRKQFYELLVGLFIIIFWFPAIMFLLIFGKDAK